MKEVRETIIRNNAKRFTIIISHEDLDGISSAIIAKRYALKTDINNIIVATSMSPVSDKTVGIIKTLIDFNNEEFNKYDLRNNIDRIIICDRALSFLDYKKLSETIKFRQLLIFDHHIGQKSDYEKIKEYDPKRVQLFFDETICATKIIAQEYTKLEPHKMNIINLAQNPILRSADIVDCWDTFKWKDIEANPLNYSTYDRTSAQQATKWNKAACTIGPKLLYEYMNNSEDLNLKNMDGFDLLVKIYEDKLDEAYDSLSQYNTIRDTRVFEIDGFRYNCNLMYIKKNSLITGEKYSLIADRILNEYKDIDIVIFMNDNMMSLRGRANSDLTPLEVARLMNLKAGGHELACGSSLLEPWVISDAMMHLFLGRKRFQDATMTSTYEIYDKVDHKAKVKEFIDRLQQIMDAED